VIDARRITTKIKMKTLFPKQRESVDSLKEALRVYNGALDSSQTGVGKTVIASYVALEFGRPVAVVCPKIVIPHWERELAEVGVTPIFISNYEKLKRGNNHIIKAAKKLFRWTLPEGTLIIWDECHKCKSPYSQNSQMLVAARQAGYCNLLLSATACQDPTEMRSLGFALGIHSLNRPEGSKKSWFSWMMQYGCKRDPWNNWVAGPVPKLVHLNQELYSKNCVKLTPKDLPNAFTDNQVITEPLAFSSLTDIARFYKQHGVTPEIVEQFLEDGGASPHILVEILRARQLAEAAKVPDILDMITDACAEGYSVAVFVNFTDTVKALADTLTHASVIVGGQRSTVREDNVQRFQMNQTNVIICNIAAGGVGVSLHDTEGGHPRMSLISPTFNVKDYIQTLGRVHRAGAKSPVVQRVLIASKTIEEKIVDKLEKKRLAMDTLHKKPTP
jgi:superfamily II DNA or RNA helicase